jgi:hypothetical protein
MDWRKQMYHDGHGGSVQLGMIRCGILGNVVVRVSRLTLELTALKNVLAVLTGFTGDMWLVESREIL